MLYNLGASSAYIYEMVMPVKYKGIFIIFGIHHIPVPRGNYVPGIGRDSVRSLKLVMFRLGSAFYSEVMCFAIRQ